MAKKIKAVNSKKKKDSVDEIKGSGCSSAFPIVGIGASAGGLETFKQFLTELSCDTGMAFVIIQHLDPNHESYLTEALSKSTKMRVREIEDGMKIEPNEVFVIPPGCDTGILRGKFTLFSRESGSHRPHMGIDFFFGALAADCGGQAIGVVLSGTATDGTEGLRAIKAENGVTLVQDPKCAKYPGMPQSAVDAEVVDFCLTIPKLAQELARLAKHPYISGASDIPLTEPKDDKELQKIFVLLRSSTGVDFSEYKPTTIRRRLARRMALLKIDNLKEYVKVLQNSPDEVKGLTADILIHVTAFFRDAEVFRKLKTSIFPALIKNRTPGTPIRIWVAGCSSGEEVYSIAISLLEFLGDRSAKFPVQVFGTDISDRMIVKAREGLYGESLIRSIDLNRQKRYFVKTEGGYRISKLVRDLCIFARHDLARDPPFSKLDVVTCRNVLIYFEQPLQKKIISTFHYCLNQPGFLLLGRTESISGHNHLFAPLDKKNKIFSRAAVTSHLRFSMERPSVSNGRPLVSVFKEAQEANRPTVDVAKQIDTLLLSQYAPAGVVINEQMEVLQYRGRTSPYLEPPPGLPQLNIFKMVGEGLFVPLKLALGHAKKKMSVVRREGLEFKQGGHLRRCNLVVIPVAKIPESNTPLFLVLFEDVPVLSHSKARGAKVESKSKKAKKERASKRAASLDNELRVTQEYLQSLNEEHQKTNDMLNSVNEELVSGNEELQSMNEELETAKEELQSTNEELTTVNDELQNRNHETALINDDLVNLLSSVEIPILILDEERRIRRFTPKARTIMNLLPTDIGRHIEDIKPNIVIENLDKKIQKVIETAEVKESEVQDREGRWHRLQIRPYKTTTNKIAGAVLSLINIDVLKRAVDDAKWAQDYSVSIVEAVQIPLLVLDDQINVISANQAFYDTFEASKAETEAKSLYELGACHWNIETLKETLGEMLEKKTSFLNKEVTCEFPKRGAKVMSLSARPIQSHDGSYMILLAIEDITGRKDRETERRALLLQAQVARSDADKANLTKDLFLATLSHELRTPLTSLLLQAQMLQRGTLDEARIKRASISIERAARTQAQLIEDLLDVSRIVTGKLKIELKDVNLATVIGLALETTNALAEKKSVRIETDLDDSVGLVSGDSIRLQQVIWNLLTNAIKFTATGNKVIVKLRAVDGFAQIQVIDVGIGIEPEFLPHVFNRFSQAEGAMTRTHGGLGLGLAIVRHLVEMHHGSVKVESPGKKRGATFTVSLPLLKTKESIDSSQSSKIMGKHSHKSKPLKLNGIRILAVEDDLGVREALAELLESVGAEVRVAASASEALEVLKKFTPDELVLDIAMPGVDGYSLLQKIRKLGPIGGKVIPALALTALASDKDRKAAFSAGFQKHLSKPVDIETLTTALWDLQSNQPLEIPI